MHLIRSQLEQLLVNPRLSPNKQNIYSLCPFCGFDEFGISLKDQHRFNCFRKKECGKTGNIFTLLSHLGRSREFAKDTILNDELEDINLGNAEATFDFDLKECKPPLGWKRVFDDDYLRGRGFTDYEFNKYQVGISSIKPDYRTILIEQNNKVIGYVSRSVKSKEWIDQYNEGRKKFKYERYKNSPGTEFTHVLWGWDEIIKDVTHTVVLVEGIFSKIPTDINLDLVNDDEWKCCVTFGAKVSPEQIRLMEMKGVKTVILLHEADTMKKLKDNAAKLALHFEVKVGYLPKEDPGDMNQEQLCEVLERLESWIEIQLNYI